VSDIGFTADDHFQVMHSISTHETSLLFFRASVIVKDLKPKGKDLRLKDKDKDFPSDGKYNETRT
jgi:hypothetical protein